MDWIGEQVRDPGVVDAYLEVQDLAGWSPWHDLVAAVPHAPREPGVYLLREPVGQRIVHVGTVGERAGAGGARGLCGRLGAHLAGHTAVGGFDEAALDAALADPAWLAQRTGHLAEHGPSRARAWAAAAVRHLAPEVSWAVRPEAHDARLLGDRVGLLLRPHGLWAAAAR